MVVVRLIVRAVSADVKGNHGNSGTANLATKMIAMGPPRGWVLGFVLRSWARMIARMV